MENLDPSVASTDQLVTSYARAASAHRRAIDSGDHEAANQQHDVVAAAYRELRRRDVRDVLLPLLDTDDLGARAWVAAHALEFAPDEGERVLGEIVAEGGAVGFSAEMTLETWRKGDLRFP